MDFRRMLEKFPNDSKLETSNITMGKMQLCKNCVLCKKNLLQFHKYFDPIVTDLAGSFVPIFGC